MHDRKNLLERFISAYPAQPATAYWRSIEIGCLVRHGLPEGLGLDLGCGDGILTDVLLSFAGRRKLVGVDIDPLEVEAARRFSFYERVHACPAQAIPEQASSFDFAISNSVLEHIPDLEGVIAELARVLKPQGPFLFTVPGPGFHRNLAGALLPGIPCQRYLENLDRRLAHYHYLPPEDWKRLCAKHGLIVESCVGYLDKAQTRRWETLSRLTGGLFYTLFGRRQRPIDIQRRLGARSLQNRFRLPQFLARILSRLISLGLKAPEQTWLPPEEASCLLVIGKRA
jgi:SAM-dependent methyltransferase